MIVAFTGFSGAGKNTAATKLESITQQDEHLSAQFTGVHYVSFASRLKDTLAALFQWDRDLLEGTTPESREWRITEQPELGHALGIENFTPLKALKMIGTRVFRQHLHEDIWILLALQEIRDALRQKKLVMITDLRFENEFHALETQFQCPTAIIQMQVPNDRLPKWFADTVPKAPTLDMFRRLNMKRSSPIPAADYEWWYSFRDCENLKKYTILNAWPNASEDALINKLKSTVVADIHSELITPASSPLPKKANKKYALPVVKLPSLLSKVRNRCVDSRVVAFLAGALVGAVSMHQKMKA